MGTKGGKRMGEGNRERGWGGGIAREEGRKEEGMRGSRKGRKVNRMEEERTKGMGERDGITGEER